MDLHDEDLTRRAVAEILRETEEQKNREAIHPMERKINPLRKTNKLFLGRTLSAINRQNKRKEDQIRQKCIKKLRELDKSHKRRRLKSESSEYNYETRDERPFRNKYHSTNDPPKNRKKSKSKPNRKRKHQHILKRRKETSSSSNLSRENPKRRKKARSSSSSSLRENSPERRKERSSSSSSSLSFIGDSPERCKKSTKDEEHWHSNESNQTIKEELEYGMTNSEIQNFEKTIAPLMLPAALCPARLQQLMQYNALMALGDAIQANPTENVQIEELSLDSSSLSDVNFDEVEFEPSVKQIDTIDVSTDDETNSLNSMQSKKGSSKRNSSASEIYTIDLNDTDSNNSERFSVVDVEMDDEKERTNIKSEESRIFVEISESDTDDVNEIETTRPQSPGNSSVVEIADSDAEVVTEIETTTKQPQESLSVVEFVEPDGDDVHETENKRKQSAENTSVVLIQSDVDKVPESNKKSLKSIEYNTALDIELD